MIRPSTSVRWRRLLPVVFVTYSLASALQVAWERDLHITAATSALLGALIFLGYRLFQVPAAHYAECGSVEIELTTSSEDRRQVSTLQS